jgi:NADH-quinone oxidoreductase subunit N
MRRVIEERFIRIEIQIIISLGIIGGLTIISSGDLIRLFIAIELFGYSQILLLLLKEDYKSSYIAIIYFILSSISSIILLLGVLIIYKNIGIISIKDIELVRDIEDIELGIRLVNLGLIFKVGSAPFHF